MSFLTLALTLTLTLTLTAKDHEKLGALLGNISAIGGGNMSAIGGGSGDTNEVERSFVRDNFGELALHPEFGPYA